LASHSDVFMFIFEQLTQFFKVRRIYFIMRNKINANDVNIDSLF